MRRKLEPTVMTPAEVANAFRVDVKTINRWSVQNKIKCFKTPGGHRRYYKKDVEELLGYLIDE